MTKTIHDQPFDDYLFDCVTIDENDLTSEYVRVPADMAYWGKRAADAERDHLLAKVRVEEAEASAQQRARDRLENDPSTKRVTEAMVTAAAQQDPALRLAQQVYADAAATRKEVAGYLSAIAAKRDMLISLGATQRHEMNADLTIRE